MSAAAYRAYPAGGAASAAAAAALGFAHDYYWPCPAQEPDGAAEAAGERRGAPDGPWARGSLASRPARGSPSLPFSAADPSPVSSTSGGLPPPPCAPDSATSPDGPPAAPSPPPPPPAAASKRSKSRTTFSPEQLQALHLRFQAQKYLSPQQIRDLGAALGLTYKQVKTWFQNQRMKFKRTQKETLWMKKGVCQPQNGFQQAAYLDIVPPPDDYPVNPAWNLHSVPSATHEVCASNQTYGSGQSYPTDYSPLYGGSQNFYPVVGGENGGFFGKPAGTCYGQQAIGYISQQKMNFYHGFSASVEYATVKMEDSYPFPNGSPTGAAFPGSSVLQHYQTPLQIETAATPSPSPQPLFPVASSVSVSLSS